MFVDLAEYHSPTSQEASITGELTFFDLTQVCYSFEEVNSPNYRRSSLCSLTLQNTTVPEAQSGFPPPPPLLTQPKRRKERTEWRGQEEKNRERMRRRKDRYNKEKEVRLYRAQPDVNSRHGSGYTFFITLHTSTELPRTTQTKKCMINGTKSKS